MDEKRFDEITQTLRDDATRRAVSRLLAGGTLAGAAGWLSRFEDGAAKRKRKKKKRKQQRCPSSLPTACPASGPDPAFCAPPGYHCCGAAAGGGACEPAYPQCCLPTVQDPQGLCIPSGSVCCTSEEGGGYCGPGQTCCPPCPGWPNGLCADPGYPCWMYCKSGFAGEGVPAGNSEKKTDAASRSADGR
jgi:hypothetical protein